MAYQSGIGLTPDTDIDVNKIPEPTSRPDLCPVPAINRDNIIIFDIETANSGTHSELTQLSAAAINITCFDEVGKKSVVSKNGKDDIVPASVSWGSSTEFPGSAA